MEKQRRLINISGIVQGVGFRPFIYSLADEYGLKGWVMNFSGGVRIDIEGSKEGIDGFLASLEKKAPPLSYIDRLEVENSVPAGYKEFTIKKSGSEQTQEVFISADVTVCKDCLGEMEDPTDRRFRYPFINCTNCGPRFTITTGIPYDRVNTTMKPFVMCEDCAREYNDPLNRRFHAQPVACHKCGPQVYLKDKDGKKIETEDTLGESLSLLKRGKIIAIKGLGGYHLACDAKNSDAVKELRKRKARDGKPFALMAKEVSTVMNYCQVNELQRTLLESLKRPIVLLERKTEEGLPFDCISSDNHLLGIMLPYTPLQYLLFDNDLDILVMTSGNKSGEPIYFKDDEAIQGLKGVADYFLVNNREIHIRTDDSVTSVFREREYVIRRSRGYVPLPIDISSVLQESTADIADIQRIPGILACGGELKNTFSIVKGAKAFISHHIGDLENIETLKSFEEGIKHFKNIFTVNPEIIVYDAHPEYLSTKYALEQKGVIKIPVQHHRAHIAACMAENGLKDSVIGVALDGTGYGDDGAIWGGEFFTGDLSKLEREAHLQYIQLPGGEISIREPWRMAFSYLYKCFGDKVFELPLDCITTIESNKIKMLKQQLDRRVNTPSTSSMGRLFDAVSAMAGLCNVITYEGEAAIKLEKVCDSSISSGYKYSIDETGRGPLIIRTDDIVKSIVEDVKGSVPAGTISGRFHRTVTNMILDICKKLGCTKGLRDIALSGGVFQNRILLQQVVEALENEGFYVYTHSRVPTNDGGIALGQAAIGLRKWMDLNKSGYGRS